MDDDYECFASENDSEYAPSPALKVRRGGGGGDDPKCQRLTGSTGPWPCLLRPLTGAAARSGDAQLCQRGLSTSIAPVGPSAAPMVHCAPDGPQAKGAAKAKAPAAAAAPKPAAAKGAAKAKADPKPEVPPLGESHAQNNAVAGGSGAGGKGKAIEEIYQKKSQLEHILLRPDTYIGSTEKQQQQMWVHDGTRMVLANISFVPGLYKIFDEILVNAADNKVRDATMDTVKVEINAVSCWERESV